MNSLANVSGNAPPSLPSSTYNGQMHGASRITVVAGGLLVATAWVAGAFGPMGRHQNIIDILAEAVAILLFLLAWRYRRDRLAVAALVVAATNFLIRTDRVALAGGIALTALAVAVAVDLVIVAAIRDRPVSSRGGTVWLAILALEAWFVLSAVDPAGDRITVLFAKPGVAPGAFAAAGLVIIALFVMRRSAFEGSLVWVVIACAAALLAHRGPQPATLLLAAAQLALLVGFFEESYRLAFHDELTGLPGRRALDETLRGLGGAFTIAMVDIDHFKRFNDRHGHDAGDQVLRMVAENLARTADGRAYRYGGEEFSIVYPGRDAAEVRDDLEALRASIANRKFALRSPDRPKVKPEKPNKRKSPAKKVTVTVSIGAAASSPRRRSPSSVLKAADKALYRAKRAGRNRLVTAGDRIK